MSRFLNLRLERLLPYTPGEQPKIPGLIKLNTNESPYPPAPGVLDVINREEAAKLRLYSDPDATNLTAAIAAHYGVSPKQVVVGNGSDEILAFAFAAFFDPAEKLLFPDITYGFYPVFAEVFGLAPTVVPLKEDFTIDPSDYTGGNVVIANPNAPTGLALTTSQIEEILKANPNHLVLVDEAYADFGENCSALPLLPKYENLLIVRTCSKSRSLAGARLGYAIGHESVVADLQKVRFSFNPYNVNRLTLLAGEASFADRAYFQSCIAKVKATRARLTEGLRALGFTVLDSQANFVFAAHPAETGATLLAKLRERRILVRHFAKPRIENFLRITVGTDEETDVLLAALADILKQRS